MSGKCFGNGKLRLARGLVVVLTICLYAGRTMAQTSSPSIQIIPKPVVVQPQAGTFTLTNGTSVLGPANEANLLAASLRPATGLPLSVTANGKADSAISMQMVQSQPSDVDGAYTLDVTPSGVTIKSSSPAGLFYGGQTLRQLLPPAAFSPSAAAGTTWSILCCHIEDKPRFQWRGMMLDCSRHFFTVDEVKKFIDELALHKMNRLHWHLTDDQGWRIEIKKYPKLTEVGSKRSGSYVFDPAHVDPANPKKLHFDNVPYGGFYTQDQVKDIVAYATARHVTIVPEIEMPGHSAAAICAYPELGVSGKPIEVRTLWGVEKHILNPNAHTIAFYQDVLTEVMGLFPSEFIHVGGDEAPKDDWNASPEIEAQIKQLGLKDSHELQSWFIGQMDKFLSHHGRHLIGWDEILEGGLTPGAAVMSWHGDKPAIEAANTGHDAVNASKDAMYFDYYQAKGPTEPHAIGGFIPLKKVYDFDPMPAAVTPEQSKYMLGAQGQLWSEYMATFDHVEYMAFPRGCALAEIDWSPAEKDYDGFIDRLKTHLERLKAMGVNARPLDAHPATTEGAR